MQQQRPQVAKAQSLSGAVVGEQAVEEAGDTGRGKDACRDRRRGGWWRGDGSQG